MLLVMHQLLAAALVRPSLPSRCAVSMSVSPSDDLLPGFRLSGVVQGTEDDEELSLWLGDYKLERRNIPGQPRNPRKLLREVMGRPAYRHEELPSRWLVWNGARWIGMLTEDLPWGFGIMQELGRSEYDRAQDPNMKYSTVSLPMDVASPAEAGQQPCEWCVASRGEWLEAPGLRCEAMSEAELEAAADERRSKRRSRGPSNEDGAFLEVCHCVACDRQGADLTLKMFRQLGADAVPTPTKGTCGGGPMVYIGMSDLKLGGLSYGTGTYRKPWRVSTALQAAEVLAEADASSTPIPSSLVAAYDRLLKSYSTSSRRPDPREALALAESALADQSVWEGFPLALSAALTRRGQLRLQVEPDDWARAEQDARAAISLDATAESPRWLLAEILWRSKRKDDAEKELDELRKLLFDRRDEIERKRAKLSGALRTDEFESLVIGLPRRRREAIEQEKRRLAFAPPLPLVEAESVNVAAQTTIIEQEVVQAEDEVRVQAD